MYFGRVDLCVTGRFAQGNHVCERQVFRLAHDPVPVLDPAKDRGNVLDDAVIKPEHFGVTDVLPVGDRKYPERRIENAGRRARRTAGRSDNSRVRS